MSFDWNSIFPYLIWAYGGFALAWLAAGLIILWRRRRRRFRYLEMREVWLLREETLREDLNKYRFLTQRQKTALLEAEVAGAAQNDAHRSLEAKIAGLNNQVNSCQAANAALEATGKERAEKIEALMKAVAEKTDLADQYQQELRSRVAEMVENRGLISQLQAQLSAPTPKIVDEGEKLSLLAEIAGKDDELRGLRDKLESAEAEKLRVLAQTQEKHLENAEIAELKQQLSEAEELLKEKGYEAAALRDQLEQKYTLVKEQVTSTSSLKVELYEANQQASALRKRVAELLPLETKMTNLDIINTDLNKQILMYRGMVEEQRSEIERLREERKSEIEPAGGEDPYGAAPAAAYDTSSIEATEQNDIAGSTISSGEFLSRKPDEEFGKGYVFTARNLTFYRAPQEDDDSVENDNASTHVEVEAGVAAESATASALKQVPEMASETVVEEIDEPLSPQKLREHAPLFKLLAAPKLPKIPGADRARLQLQSPNRLHFYWVSKKNPYDSLKRVMGRGMGNYTLGVRLVNLTDNSERVMPAAASGSTWFDVDSNARYQAELGFFAPRRPFVRVMFSNTVQTPRPAPSWRMATDEDFAIRAVQFVNALETAGFAHENIPLRLDSATRADADAKTLEIAGSIAHADLQKAEAINLLELRWVFVSLLAGVPMDELKSSISPELSTWLANIEKVNPAALSLDAIREKMSEVVGEGFVRMVESGDIEVRRRYAHSVVGGSLVEVIENVVPQFLDFPLAPSVGDDIGLRDLAQDLPLLDLPSSHSYH